MNENNNVVNEIQRAKEETIQEVTRVILNGRENLNVEQLKKQMLRRVSNIIEENNLSRQEDLILNIVNNGTQNVFKEMNNSFNRKGNCIVTTLNTEFRHVQSESTSNQNYDLSQGLNELLRRALNNYDYEKKECRNSVSKQIMNNGFNSNRSIVYQTIRSELQRRGIYDENYIDDVIVQIDRRVKTDIGSAYDAYGIIDNKLTNQIENICVGEIKRLENELEVNKEDEIKSNNEKDSKFSDELQSLTNSFNEVVSADVEDNNSSEKINSKSKESLPADLFK